MSFRKIGITIGFSLAVCTASLMYSDPARAMVATEATQLMNNAELVLSYAKAAQQYEELLAGQVTRLAQYETMLIHLVQLPEATLNTFSEAWNGQVSFFNNLSTAVSNIADLNSKVKTMFNGSYSGDDATWLAQYQGYRSQLNTDYSSRYSTDLSALDQLATMSSSLSSLTDKSASISGTTQGLQLIARTNAIQAQQNNAMQSLMQRQALRQESDDATSAQTDQAISQMAINQIAAAKAAQTSGADLMSSTPLTIVKPSN
ncbi:hypothetical protein ACQUFY_27065 (plasmid) [Robbsia andropogonis]|uniref:hypothetical protein n=1 Tax=Robbsia andropogonis TaxID=28092 RepID=UPI003D1E0EDD